MQEYDCLFCSSPRTTPRPSRSVNVSRNRPLQYHGPVAHWHQADTATTTYHLEDVFGAIRRLHSWLVDHGTLYVETQSTKVISDLPIFEYASDVYPTIAHQDRASLGGVGISNYLFPNPPAVFNLAYSYGFSCELLGGAHNTYSARNPLRDIYRLTKLSQGETWAVPKGLQR